MEKETIATLSSWRKGKMDRVPLPFPLVSLDGAPAGSDLLQAPALPGTARAGLPQCAPRASYFWEQKYLILTRPSENIKMTHFGVLSLQTPKGLVHLLHTTVVIQSSPKVEEKQLLPFYL